MSVFVCVILAASLGAHEAVAQDSPVVVGTVRLRDAVTPAGTGTVALPGAVVEVRQGLIVRRARAAEDGSYRVVGLGAGPAELVAFHLATRSVAIGLVLPSAGETRVDLLLRGRVIPLSGLHVVAPPEPERVIRVTASTSRGSAAIGLRSLEASPGMVESGLASALAVDEATAPDRVLYLRGSTVDARLVLLDGAPILTPFHVAGLVEPFDTDLLGRTDIYLGGAPARYPDGISYLLDVRTRPARRDRPHVEVAADGLVLGLKAEAPLPWSGGVLVGGRLLHGAQESLRNANHPFPYRYDDLLVRAGIVPVPGHELRLTGFRNDEGVRLDLEDRSLALDAAPTEEDAAWGNRSVSLGYEGVAGGVALSGVAALSRYRSALPVDWQDPVLAHGIGERSRVAGEASLPFGGGSLGFGASVERILFEYRFDAPASLAARVSSEPRELATTASSLFGEWSGPVASGLDLRAGLRAERFSHERGELRLAPRASITVALGDRVSLWSSVGRYHQVLPAPGLNDGPEDAGPEAARYLDWDPRLPVASASHWIVALEQRFDRGLSLSLAGFLKGFSGLGEAARRSRASGTELRVSREGERLRGWFGYGLSWFWVDEGPNGSTRFDGRHLLAIGLEGTVPAGVELRGTFGYGAGLPMTAIGLPQSEGVAGAPDGEFASPSEPEIMNSGGGADPLELAPEGDFLRLDLEAAWPIGARVGGRDTQLRPYVRIVNALNRRDPLFYYYDRWLADEARPLAERPLLPLLGLEWRF
jgi:hypothetical protein